MKKIIPVEKSLLFGNRNTGLQIGNLTSQFFANIYLNKLDHFIKEELGFERYIRYVDDFILLDEDNVILEKTIGLIDSFLKNNLHLCLCQGKTVLRPISAGVDFLGYFIKPSHTLVRNKTIKRFKKRLFIYKKIKFNEIKDNNLPSCINSYFGHFSHANSYNLRKNFCLNNLSSIDFITHDYDYRKITHIPIKNKNCLLP